MNHRVPDFDLRPRRPAMPVPMRSSLDVDDAGDTLDALVGEALARARSSDARHTALAALPTSLCRPSTGVEWPDRRPRPRWAPDRLTIASLVCSALALVVLASAMSWRIQHPRVVHIDETTPVVQVANPPELDAISSASSRAVH